ncbi:hypothetical protein CLF_100640 [Clonorchis sinensis]|uniref:Uncharacterized protein n=1 Tax=Clonorchis sinensis TaxID=79923 RepID=G7Y3X2_CLOSI|nr:hypothetical protein CLF_100640 [Clonorchis sinensis]
MQVRFLLLRPLHSQPLQDASKKGIYTTWSSQRSAFVDSYTKQTFSRVVARRGTSRDLKEISVTLVKHFYLVFRQSLHEDVPSNPRLLFSDDLKSWGSTVSTLQMDVDAAKQFPLAWHLPLNENVAKHWNHRFRTFNGYLKTVESSKLGKLETLIHFLDPLVYHHIADYPDYESVIDTWPRLYWERHGFDGEVKLNHKRSELPGMLYQYMDLTCTAVEGMV